MAKMEVKSYRQMFYIVTIGALTLPVIAEMYKDLKCPFDEARIDFMGGYRKNWGHNHSEGLKCVTIFEKTVATDAQNGILDAYSKYCSEMDGRVAIFDDAIGLPAEPNWFPKEELRLFSGHEVVEVVENKWQFRTPDTVPFLPECAAGLAVQCLTAVYRASSLKGKIMKLNGTNCFAVMEPTCVKTDPILVNCSGTNTYCQIDQAMYDLPTCRVFMTTGRGDYRLDRFRHCFEQHWDYFACETEASDKWVYRKRRECFYNESTGTCWMYKCELTAKKLYYKCDWRKRIACTCPCADVEWSPWSAPSATCGVTMKVRYKPIRGLQMSGCIAENSSLCCSEHAQEVLEPCSEYHHGTNIMFKRKPCANGLQVPHPQGGSRCECMTGYAGMLCEIELGGAAAKVRELSAIITNVIIVVCSVLLALALFVLTKKSLKSQQSNTPSPSDTGPGGILSELIDTRAHRPR